MSDDPNDTNPEPESADAILREGIGALVRQMQNGLAEILSATAPLSIRLTVIEANQRAVFEALERYFTGVMQNRLPMDDCENLRAILYAVNHPHEDSGPH